MAEDEAAANEAAEVAGAIKADCEADLAEALPALEAAINALDTLKPSDISQVGSAQFRNIDYSCALLFLS